MIPGCGRTLPNRRKKFCAKHAEEAAQETARREQYNRRRQREADALKAAVRRGL